MSSLQMRGGSLSEAARRSDQAAECSAKLKVGDDLGQVSVVMKGGSLGVAADEVGRFVDGMAKEMTEYTKNNVLLQAAQSMLSQANQNSSSVLSLLQ